MNRDMPWSGWALGLRVGEITIREDRPGEHAKIAHADHLPLIDQLAVHTAGRKAEELFGHRLPAWASDRDRMNAISLLVSKQIPETELN
jgi:hypothetical protein